MPSARAKRSAAQAELPSTAGAEDVSGGGHGGNGNVHGGSGDGAVAETTKNNNRRSSRSNTAMNSSKSPPVVVEKDHEAKPALKEKQKEPERPPPVIHYRIGDILTKHFALDEKNDVFEVRIPAECTVSTNRQVRGHQLWGTDVYTSDSDLVAVLIHCGFYVPSLQVPPSLLEIRARVRRVDDVSDEFRSSSRNGIRSRSWGKSGFAKKKSAGEKVVAAAASSQKEEVKEEDKKESEDGGNGDGGEGGAVAPVHPENNNYDVLQTANGQIINADDFGMVVESAEVVTVNQQIIELKPTPPEALRYMVVPTFVPEDKERAQRTRAASNANVNVARKKRMIREVTVLYNLCNEPWLKYSMAAVADKGFKKSQWTSARLRRDTLYLETKDGRYQLSWVKGKGKDENEGSYQFAKCKRALPLEEMRKKGIPLPKDELKDEIKNLSWDEVKFGVRGLKVKESEYPVTRLQFLAQTSPA